MDPMPAVSRRSTRTGLESDHSKKIADSLNPNSDEGSDSSESESDNGDSSSSTGCPISTEHTKIIDFIKNSDNSKELDNLQQKIEQRKKEEWTKVDAMDQSLLDKLLATDCKFSHKTRKVVTQLCQSLVELQPQLLTTVRRPEGLSYKTTAFYLGFSPKRDGRPMDKLFGKFLKTGNKFIQSYEILTTKCGTEEDTCLHMAVMNHKKSLELVDLLLSDSSSLRDPEKRNLIIQQDKNGLTPLHIAVSLNISPERRDQIGKMVEFCNPDDLLIQDSEGRTPLHLAVACADINLKTRITAGNENSDIRNQDNSARAYENSHLDALKILVKKQPEALRMMTTKLPQRSPYQYRLSMSNPKSSGPISNSNSSLEGPADPISFYLIDQYMHLDSYDDTIKYLYGACTSKLNRKTNI